MMRLNARNIVQHNARHQILSACVQPVSVVMQLVKKDHIVCSFVLTGLTRSHPSNCPFISSCKARKTHQSLPSVNILQQPTIIDATSKAVLVNTLAQHPISSKGSSQRSRPTMLSADSSSLLLRKLPLLIDRLNEYHSANSSRLCPCAPSPIDPANTKWCVHSLSDESIIGVDSSDYTKSKLLQGKQAFVDKIIKFLETTDLSSPDLELPAFVLHPEFRMILEYPQDYFSRPYFLNTEVMWKKLDDAVENQQKSEHAKSLLSAKIQELNHQLKESTRANSNLLAQNQKLENQQQELETSIKSLNVENERLHEEVLDRQIEVEVAKADCDGKAKQLEQTKNDLYDKNKQLEQTRNDLHDKTEQLEQTKEELEDKDSQLEQTEEALEDKDNQLQQTKDELEHKAVQLEQTKTDLAGKTEELKQQEFINQQKDSRIASLDEAYGKERQSRRRIVAILERANAEVHAIDAED